MPTGRKPKPVELRLVDGSRIRPKHRNTPKPPPDAPPMPPRLKVDKVAKAKWSELLPLVCSMKVMTAQDAEALATLCEVHSSAQICLIELRASGPIIRGDNGVVKPNPAGSLYRGLISQQMSIMAEFGLTPAARVRLGAKTDEDEDDPLAEFIA